MLNQVWEHVPVCGMAWSLVAAVVLSALLDTSYTLAYEQLYGNGFFPPTHGMQFPRLPGSLRPMTDRDVLFGHTPGKCTTLLETGSPEDCSVMPDGRAIMSTGFFGPDIGRIWYMDLKNPKQEMREYGIKGNFNQKTFIPLGMATWTDPKSGKSYLIVSNHNKYNTIDFFEICPTVLKYTRSVPVSGFVKGLFMVDKDKFYIVRMSSSTEQRVLNLESSTGKGSGAILYFDGKKQYEIVKGLIMPVGMRASNDGRYLYLAEYGGSSIHVFKRDTTNNFKLKPIQSVFVGTGPDLINICPETGNLWVGAHPNHRALQNFLLGKKVVPPSQVLRMTIDQTCGKVDGITEVYLDSGKNLAASSFGDVYQNKLFIGSMGQQFAMCELECAGK